MFRLHIAIIPFFILLSCSSHEGNIDPDDNNIDSSENYLDNDTELVSESELKHFLSRPITMSALTDESICYYDVCVGKDNTYYNIARYKKDLKMLPYIEATFIGRVASIWGTEDRLRRGFFSAAKKTCQDIKELYKDKGLEEPIVQAAVFEIISRAVNVIDIPDYVAKKYGIFPRRFRYDKMLYKDGYGVDNWGANSSIPDMSRKETQMWFYFMATQFIKAGYEAIHFGQIHLMDVEDSLHEKWWNMLSNVRDFAKSHNRGFVLCDAHTNGDYVGQSNQLLFDFHSSPIRPIDIKGTDREEGNGGEAEILSGVRNVIYNDSKGGDTFFGWETESLPYLVEFDNNGISNSPDTYDVGWYVWGWDEITWYALQPLDYRKEWLKYAYNKIHELDPVGNLQVPGLRELTRIGESWPDLFHATMGDSKADYNIENTIKYLWDLPNKD